MLDSGGLGRLIAFVLALASVGGGLFVSRSAFAFNDSGAANLVLDAGLTIFVLATLVALVARMRGKARGSALLFGGALQGGLAIAHPLSTLDYGPGFFGLTLVFASLMALGLGSWRLLDRRR